MENNLRFLWTPVEASPDPEYGLPVPRSSHGVSVLAGGDALLVYGGENVARTPIEAEASCCWICCGISSTSKAKPAWKRIECKSTSGMMPPSRIAHSQAVYNDQYVYIFGGRAGITMEEKAMNDLWVLDTTTYTWSTVSNTSGPIPEARSFHRMICVGSHLYVFGGCSAKHGRLNDLHKFDIIHRTWHNLGSSVHLRGRGGPNLLSMQSGHKLGVIAGFAGEETSDGHAFDITKQTWDEHSLNAQLSGLRPRSVCVSASFSQKNIAVIFGGEVDPSDRGHEGAGGFENDIVVLNEATGAFLETIHRPSDTTVPWPEERGWSDASSFEDAAANGGCGLFLFGGLTGDDANPKRLNDLWRLDINKV